MKNMLNHELIEYTFAAAASKDHWLGNHCAAEANYRNPETRSCVKGLLSEASLQQIEWWSVAVDTALRIRKSTTGTHNLYVVLLTGFESGPAHGIYVGESFYTPDTRLEQHQSGKRASRHVRNFGVCLLPELYEHLNPLSKAEAKELESALAIAFAKANIRVKGGH